MIAAGVNVFRFNMKHNVPEWHEERIALVDKVAAEMGTTVGILIDLQGPELRIETPEKQDMPVKKGEKIKFTESFIPGVESICLPHTAVFEVMKPGDKVLIDDGFWEFEVVEAGLGEFTAVAADDYVITNRKGVILPGKHIDVPSLVEKDLERLDMATRSRTDFVALSFCRNRRDVILLKAEMQSRNLDAKIVAKIENQIALDNIDEIADEADAIMVARGDLGVEVPVEEIAYLQRKLINEARSRFKPVIVATQMLMSMTEKTRPTRAEATDISHAVWDGADAVMLSNETASGKHPLKAVEAMARIATFNESKTEKLPQLPEAQNSTQAIVFAAADILDGPGPIKPTAAVVFTETGLTARTLATLRPKVPIIAVTHNQKTRETLSLSYGVETYLSDFPKGNFVLPREIIDQLKEKGRVQKDDLILVVHGEHWSNPGSTNAMALVQV